ncbi:MAG: alpha/beta hydrolase [Bowdeniella nasicola]|nr:alpha/beta hydrolase [Bowdeniella nasicola]
MTELGYHESGNRDGIPLVALHAFPLDHRMFNPMINELGERWVIAPDAPGFGDSASPRRVADSVDSSPFGLECYADAIAAASAEARLDRIVLAGVSMGGYVAMAVAERHPDLIAGLALIDTKSRADGDEAAENRRIMAEEVGRGVATSMRTMPTMMLGDTTLAEHREVRTELVHWIGQAPLEGIAWAQLAIAERPDRTEVLRGLDVPAVVIRGAEDKLSSAADHEAMAEALGCAVETVNGVGHLAPLEAPAEVARIIAGLMDRVQEES